MYALLSLVIPFVLLHHGFNSIVLKIISEIKSGHCCPVNKRTNPIG